MLAFLQKEAVDEITGAISGRMLEVRLRADKRTVVFCFANGAVKKTEISYVPSQRDLDKAILRLCNFSYFSSEESLKRGFIVSTDGERIGVCGECVLVDGKVSAIKNVTSLCVRFAESAEGCSGDFYKKHMLKAKNCLVISPPFHGKTTFIRDLGRNLSDIGGYNCLYIDERDEFSASGKFDLGKYSDVMKFCDKKYGLFNGVRTLNPDVVLCDEIMSEDDAEAVKFACSSGVKVIMSVHGDRIERILSKPEINSLVRSGVIELFAELSEFNVKRVLNEKLVELK